MPARINIPPDTRYGKLVVIGLSQKRGILNQIYWDCLCDCGLTTSVRSTHLRDHKIESCGKCPRESKSITHGMTYTPEHGIWSKIKGRCLNPNDPAYFRYGGRGITLFAEWVNDFAAFYAHVGPRPSPQYTMERIDNNKGYEPGNLRWDTRTAQARNRRSNHLETFRDETLSVAEWGERGPITAALIYKRLDLGWTIERALTQPVRQFTGHAGKIAAKHRRRAHEAGNGGSFTAQEWLDLCKRFNYCCAACGEKKPLAADHIVPVSKGGTSYISNIQPLCTPCNTRKATKIIDYREGKPRTSVQLRLVV